MGRALGRSPGLGFLLSRLAVVPGAVTIALYIAAIASLCSCLPGSSRAPLGLLGIAMAVVAHEVSELLSVANGLRAASDSESLTAPTSAQERSQS